MTSPASTPETPRTRFKSLDSVFNAIIASKIYYVYYGYLTQGHKEMLQIIFKTANRRGFTVREYDLEALAKNAQYDLFHDSCSTDHLSESLIHGKSKTSRFHAA